MAQPAGGLLEGLHHALQGGVVAGLQGGGHLLQVGAHAERLAALPEHQGLEAGLGGVHRLHDAFQHLPADGVAPGTEAENGDVVVQAPQAHAGGLQGDPAQVRPGFSPQAQGDALAGIDRQAGAPAPGVVRGGIGAIGAVHLVHPADPVRQRDRGHGVPRLDVLTDPAGDVRPAGGLPDLEGSLLPAEAPAQGQVHVPHIVGDGLQPVGGVVEQVAVDGPEEPGLGVVAPAQGGQPPGRVALLQQACHLVGRAGVAGAVIPLLRV